MADVVCMNAPLEVEDMLAAFEECGRETEFFGFDTLEEALDVTCPLQFDVQGPLGARIFRDAQSSARKLSRPAEIPSTAYGAAVRAVRGGNTTVAALPVENSAARAKTPSAQKDALNLWLGSDIGKEWQAERAELFGGV